MKRKTTAIFLILMSISLFGCTTLTINLTPESKYLEALEWYNDNLELYLTHYRVQPEAVKAEWREKYHPIFQIGDIALTTWKGQMPQGEESWLTAKRQILATLLTLNIVEVK